MNEIERFLTAIARNNLPALRKLLNKQNANACDEDGFTLLMNAAMYDDTNPEVVRLLLARGADVGTADARHYTALHFAARDNGPEIVGLLLAAGGDVAAVNDERNTPLHLCILGKCDLEVVQLLLKAGSDPKRKNCDGDSPLVMVQYSDDPQLQQLVREAAGAAGKKRRPGPKKAAKPKGTGKAKRSKVAAAKSNRKKS